jgi:hypothetical protein
MIPKYSSIFSIIILASDRVIYISQVIVTLEGFNKDTTRLDQSAMKRKKGTRHRMSLYLIHIGYSVIYHI